MQEDISREFESDKQKLMQSKLDQPCKTSLLKALSAAAVVHSGATLEDKVQSMAESMHHITMSQIAFLSTIDQKIESINNEKCKSCKAMNVANDIEEQNKREEIINEWKKQSGYKEPEHQAGEKKPEEKAADMTVKQIVKTLVLKPWVWIWLSVLAFSPYGVDMMNAIANAVKMFTK